MIDHRGPWAKLVYSNEQGQAWHTVPEARGDISREPLPWGGLFERTERIEPHKFLRGSIKGFVVRG